MNKKNILDNLGYAVGLLAISGYYDDLSEKELNDKILYFCGDLDRWDEWEKMADYAKKAKGNKQAWNELLHEAHMLDNQLRQNAIDLINSVWDEESRIELDIESTELSILEVQKYLQDLKFSNVRIAKSFHFNHEVREFFPGIKENIVLIVNLPIMFSDEIINSIKGRFPLVRTSNDF